MLKCSIRVGLRLALLVSPTAAIAGAWTQPEGHGQVIVTMSASSASRAFNGSGLSSVPRYSKMELQGLIEYGLTDRFTLMLAPGLQHIDIGAPANSKRTGFGHTEIGGRYRLLQFDSWVLSAQATARLPGVSDTSVPANIGYTGYEADLRILLGRAFVLGGTPAFVDLQLAQRYSQDYSNEFRADFTLGLYPAARWLVLLQSFNIFSEGGGTALAPTYEYYKFQLSGVYALTPRWAVQAGAFTTYAGRNALQENGGIVGLWYKF